MLILAQARDPLRGHVPGTPSGRFCTSSSLNMPRAVHHSAVLPTASDWGWQPATRLRLSFRPET